MNLAREGPNPQGQFPTFAVALVSVMGTALLVASCYVFVVKCCSVNPLTRSRRDEDDDNDDDESFIALSPATWSRGMDDSAIRDIPSFPFRGGETGASRCAVCLSEFRARDTLRALPICDHAFHSECVDVWLRANANCPLCRAGVAAAAIRRPLDRVVAAPSSSPQACPESLVGSDEDFVVIELWGGGGQRERDEVDDTGEASGSPRKRRHHVSIMGDEGIDVRGRCEDDGQFCVEPMRRSFSWDSATGRELYSAFHDMMFQKSTRPAEEVCASAGEGGGGGRRSRFPFRHGRGSRKAVVPFEM